MRWSIRHQLVLTYLLISLITAGVTYGLVLFTSEQRINQLTLEQQTREMKQEVVAWYQTERSWNGFQNYFQTIHPIHLIDPEIYYRVDGAPNDSIKINGLRPKHHGIVSSSDILLTPYLDFEVGQPIPKAFLMDAEPIYLQNEHIAWIIPPEATGLRLSSQLKIFLANIHQIILIAILAGVCASMLLGTWLSRWLLKPILLLHAAMGSMAKGKLSQQLPAVAQNELGDLAQGFNQMSASVTTADEKRRQLVADITHDLSSPVQVISGYVELAHMGQMELDQARLEAISTELELIRALVDDMNLLAKTDAHNLPLTLELLSVDSLLDKVYRRFVPICVLRKVSLSSTVAEELPILKLDEQRMIQVFGNLIQNALKHTPSGGSISLKACQNGNHCVLTVEDTGCGISSEQLPHLFDRFYRGDRARSGSTGSSGLGLSIAKGLLEMQGGTISAHSDGKSGSVFVIRIPVV